MSSDVTRTNYSANSILTSTALNADFNQILTRINDFPGDQITNATVTKDKLASGAIANSIIATKTSAYTVTTSDQVLLGDASGGAFTFTLPTASGNSGISFIFKKTDSSTNAITIDANGSETIDGDLTYSLIGQYAYVKIVSDGSNYVVTERSRLLTGYLKDVKANNTAGGTFTSGSFQTRTLNTTEGDFLHFGSLSSNQFTLIAGTYEIEAIAPAFTNANTLGSHKAILYNVTDASNALIGSNGEVTVVSSSGQSVNSSFVKGIVTISSSTVFEIRHRCDTTQSSNGFGPQANFGVDEIYTIVKLTKIN